MACHKKGTHSLQAIISIIKGDEEEQLFETSLSEYIVELSKVLMIMLVVRYNVLISR